MSNTYIICGTKSWNMEALQYLDLPPNHLMIFLRSQDDLEELLKNTSLEPRYIFFMHWNWRVPKEIHETHECICFHMTDLPYGRGGSPLQNLIVRGIKDTQMTALQMVDELDAGPVYMKRPLSLEGSAKEIYVRASKLVVEMINWIAEKEPTPIPQTGKVSVFKRRTPDKSRLPKKLQIEEVYNFIRMLDAPGYPKAFLEYGDFRFELEDACLIYDKVEAKVTITCLS